MLLHRRPGVAAHHQPFSGGDPCPSTGVAADGVRRGGAEPAGRHRPVTVGDLHVAPGDRRRSFAHSTLAGQHRLRRRSGGDRRSSVQDGRPLGCARAVPRARPTDLRRDRAGVPARSQPDPGLRRTPFAARRRGDRSRGSRGARHDRPGRRLRSRLDLSGRRPLARAAGRDRAGPRPASVGDRRGRRPSPWTPAGRVSGSGRLPRADPVRSMADPARHHAGGRPGATGCGDHRACRSGADRALADVGVRAHRPGAGIDPPGAPGPFHLRDRG